MSEDEDSPVLSTRVIRPGKTERLQFDFADDKDSGLTLFDDCDIVALKHGFQLSWTAHLKNNHTPD